MKAFDIHFAPFVYEKTPGADRGFSVRDARDNAVAHCYVEQNAVLVRDALNHFYASNGRLTVGDLT